MKVLILTGMPMPLKKLTYLYFRMKNGELSIILHMYNKIGLNLQFLLVNMIEHVMVVIMQNCTDYDSVNMLMICKVITSNNIIN